jgi:hypothetical protein
MEATVDSVIESNFPRNVYFLDDESVFVHVGTNECTRFLPDNADNIVHIIGCTLWSMIDDIASLMINDYCMIRDFTPEKSRKLFNASVEYILDELDEYPIPTILMTHHGAHPVCNGHHAVSPCTSAFVTHIPELYTRRNLKICISGHTHSCIDKTLEFEDGNRIRFVSNQRGYPDEDTGAKMMGAVKVIIQ